MRLLNYVIPFISISIAIVLMESYKQSAKFRMLCMLSYFLFCLITGNYFYLTHENWRRFYPYYSIFTKQVDLKRENYLYDYRDY